MGKRRLRVAIDGPAGAGKSTVARAVAKRLGYTYLDTGAMYRALALTAVDRDIPLDDPARLGEMAGSLDLTAREENGVFRVWVDGEELTDRLRDPGTDKAVKILAMHRPVREVLVRIQRELAKDGGIVMEGRDITSVVLPDAEVKVFLTADVEERARRRWQELQDKGVEMTLEEVLGELVERDRKDHEREWGRLVLVPDSVLVDTSDKTVDQVVDEITRLCEEKRDCSTR
ncbi:MAG: (d)CMP kinase [Bacillota bacterium]|jgi:cytidylate kinase